MTENTPNEHGSERTSDGPFILPTPEERTLKEEEERRKLREEDTKLAREAHIRQAKASETQANWAIAATIMAFIALIATVAATYFNMAQMEISRDALKSSDASSEITLGEMKKQATALNAQVNALTEANKINAESFRKSTEIAERSLRLSIENANLDRRPWVAVKSISFVAEPIADHKNIISIMFSNSGKTPALNFTISDARIYTEVIGEDPSQSPTSIQRIPDTSSHIVPPGGEVNIRTFIDFRPQGLVRLKEGKIRVVIRAKTTYRAISGKSHRTDFCVTYPSQSESITMLLFHNCSTGQFMN